jgi:predicted permease
MSGPLERSHVIRFLTNVLLTETRCSWRRFRSRWLINSMALVSLLLATVCVITVGLLLQAVLYSDLPIPNPSGLVAVCPSESPANLLSAYPQLVSESEFSLLSYKLHTLSSTFGWYDYLADINVNGRFERGDLIVATQQYFSALELVPAIGRTFQDTDYGAQEHSATPVAVITYPFWLSHFGARADILGAPLRIGKTTFSIIGVTPRNFGGMRVGIYADAIVPFDFTKTGNDPPAFWMMGRIRSGVTVAQVSAEMQTRWASIAHTADQPTRKHAARFPFIVVASARHGFAQIRERYRNVLIQLTALTGFLLLIAYLNVGCLLLSRTIATRQSFSMKLALGASRATIWVGPALDAALLLSVSNGAALIIGKLVVPTVLKAMWTGAFPPEFQTSPGLPLLGYFLALLLIGSLAVSILPILSLSYVTAKEIAREGHQIIGSIRKLDALQSGFLTAQTAVSLIIIFATLSVAQHLFAIVRTPLGFDPSHVVEAWLAPIPDRPIDDRVHYYRALLQTIRQLPGVEDVTISHTWTLPTPPGSVLCRKAGSGQLNGAILAENNSVGPSFFSVFHIPLLWGGDFSPVPQSSDGADVIISESLAIALFANPNPLGELIEVDADGRGAWKQYRIAGVVGNARINDPHVARPISIYFPIFADVGELRTPVLQARITPGYERSVEEGLLRVVPSSGKEYVWREKMATDLVQDAISKEGLAFALSSVCALLSLLLSLAGIFGVASYVAGLRTKEFALRIVVGASHWDIVGNRLWNIVGSVLLSSLLAAAVLWVLGKSGLQLISNLAQPNPLWFIGTVLLVLAVVLSASLAPLLRFRTRAVGSILREL